MLDGIFQVRITTCHTDLYLCSCSCFLVDKLFFQLLWAQLKLACGCGWFCGTVVAIAVAQVVSMTCTVTGCENRVKNTLISDAFPTTYAATRNKLVDFFFPIVVITNKFVRSRKERRVILAPIHAQQHTHSLALRIRKTTRSFS